MTRDLKVCFIADTHGSHREMEHPIPKCDLLVSAGDVTKYGSRSDLHDFCAWMANQAHQGVIVAGNHDACFSFHPEESREICEYHNITYLQDEAIVIEGVKFFGSPWTPQFGDWHFMYFPMSRDWSVIPDGTDVLITHGPPAGILDVSGIDGKGAGCLMLRNRVREVKPKYHVFGHIHAAYGMHYDGFSNISYYNVAISDEGYVPCRKPIILDFKGGVK